jgi:hypothetical protein
MDLKFKIPLHEDLMEAMDLTIEQSKQWYLDMLRIKPSLKLHTVDPDKDTISLNWTALPNSLRLYPMPKNSFTDPALIYAEDIPTSRY